MKTCPECKTAYKDETLTRCPNDGAELITENSSNRDSRTGGVKSVKPADAQKSKGNLNLILIAGAVVVILGALWWYWQKSANNPATVKPAANSPTKAPNTSTNPVPDTKPPTMTDVPVGNAQTPSEAYRMLFAAVKSQDSAKIKSMLSKGSMGLAGMASGQQKKPIEEVIKNGFSETTFVDDYPQMRDERVKGNFGAVEVWNETRKQWDDIPFILEDGSWKAAFGDAFANKWQSPGKGMAVIAQENANANNPNAMIQKMPAANSNTAGNFRSGGKVTKPKNQ
jgi:hypothetical protein